MEQQKILNLLNEAHNSKLVTRKKNMINDQLNPNNDVGNEIIYNTELLKPNLSDSSDAYILVRDNITIIGRNTAIGAAFKTCAPFTTCIIKIDRTAINDVEDLDLVIPMCKFELEVPMYKFRCISSNYSDTTGNLSFYSKDEATNFNDNIADINNYFRSFKYKTKLI